MSFTRRNLIQGLVLTLGVEPGRLLRWHGRQTRDVTARLAQVLPAPEPVTGTLAGPELEDLLAFAELLVEGRPLSPVERGHLVDHIEDRAKHAEYYLPLYRRTVGLLNRLAGARFSTLAVAQRIALITRHRLTSLGLQPGEHLDALPEEMRALRTRAVPDLIGGYYGSPAGWAIVGYDAFPGRCGDLTRYTSPER